MNHELVKAIIDIMYEFPIVALATIVQTWGSTPRKAGARMIICPDGRTIGTIGGGCSEGEVKNRARIIIDTCISELCLISLLGEVAADEGMVCGGKMEVFIEPVTAKEAIIHDR